MSPAEIQKLCEGIAGVIRAHVAREIDVAVLDITPNETIVSDRHLADEARAQFVTSVKGYIARAVAEGVASVNTVELKSEMEQLLSFY